MKSYTDIEQSIKLSKIIPVESADMSYDSCEDEYGIRIANLPSFSKPCGEDIPCWSLAALLEVLRDYEIYQKTNEGVGVDCCDYVIASEGDETLLDLVVNMIVLLHEKD